MAITIVTFWILDPVTDGCVARLVILLGRQIGGLLYVTIDLG